MGQAWQLKQSGMICYLWPAVTPTTAQTSTDSGSPEFILHGELITVSNRVSEADLREGLGLLRGHTQKPLIFANIQMLQKEGKRGTLPQGKVEYQVDRNHDLLLLLFQGKRIEISVTDGEKITFRTWPWRCWLCNLDLSKSLSFLPFFSTYHSVWLSPGQRRCLSVFYKQDNLLQLSWYNSKGQKAHPKSRNIIFMVLI